MTIFFSKCQERNHKTCCNFCSLLALPHLHFSIFFFNELWKVLYCLTVLLDGFDLFSVQKAGCQISLGFIAGIIINSVLYLLSGHRDAFSVMSFHSQSWQLSIHEGMPTWELKYPASVKKGFWKSVTSEVLSGISWLWKWDSSVCSLMMDYISHHLQPPNSNNERFWGITFAHRIIYCNPSFNY